MKKLFNRRVIAIILLFIFILSNSFINVYAMTSKYGNGEEDVIVTDSNPNAGLQTFSKIIMPVVFPIFLTIQNLVKEIMRAITGSYFFPWADTIIFNSIPVLDVNFIKPAPGSFFLKSDGVTETAFGQAFRGIYFTILSICVAFLGIAVAVNVIKMLVAQVASAKARYKEMINATLLTLVLLFGLHYLMAFVFYINEQLVNVAANLAINGTSSAGQEVMDKMDAEYDKDSKKILENFYDACNVTSFLSPITIVKKAAKELVNVIADLASKAKGFFDKVFGKDDPENAEYSLGTGDDRTAYYDEVFPSKKDIIGYFSDKEKVGEHGEEVAAYLIRQYDYRSQELKLAAGNDANSISSSGIMGPIQKAINTVAWASGVVDTGLNALENLYGSTWYVCNKGKTDFGINSTKDYHDKIEECNDIILKKGADKSDVKAARLKITLLEAYYRYIYEGDDKEKFESKDFISNLGEYFLRDSYYIDVEKGEWSSTTINVVSSMLFCIFVLQSVLFLIAYIKRLLSVMILALIGPFTIIVDYMKKSY